MLLEDKLCKWLLAGLDIYRANPLMLEPIFFDQSQSGVPSFLDDGVFQDLEKRWIPHEYSGGTLRWGGAEFPIVDNSVDTLAVTGDPSTAVDFGVPFYQIVPPAVAGLTTFLQQQSFTVLSTFAQVPTQMPALTIRLEKDEQAETYLGENLEAYAVDGVEFDIRAQAITGNYLLSIWTLNREATLWLYAWLVNYLQNSLPMFTTWGLYDVSLSGSDLDPQLQYLAENTFARHLMLSATRLERAVTTRQVDWVSSVCIKVLAHYAQFHVPVPGME